MRFGPIVALLLSVSLTAHSEDNVTRVRKAIEHSTLDQSATPSISSEGDTLPVV
jgi:hypothetical protein